MAWFNTGTTRHVGPTTCHRAAMSSTRDEQAHAVEGRRLPIVVGVDGSSGSIVALEYAMHLSDAIGRPVEAVTIYDPCPGATTMAWGPDSHQVRLRHREAEGQNDFAVGPVSRAGGVDVRQRVLAGQTREKLVELSRSASFVVVGQTRPGLWHALSPGCSVSQHLARRAHCTMVVVPEARRIRLSTSPEAARSRNDQRSPLPPIPFDVTAAGSETLTQLSIVRCNLASSLHQASSPELERCLVETLNDIDRLVARLQRPIDVRHEPVAAPETAGAPSRFTERSPTSPPAQSWGWS